MRHIEKKTGCSFRRPIKPRVLELKIRQRPSILNIVVIFLLAVEKNTISVSFGLDSSVLTTPRTASKERLSHLAVNFDFRAT